MVSSLFDGSLLDDSLFDDSFFDNSFICWQIVRKNISGRYQPSSLIFQLKASTIENNYCSFLEIHFSGCNNLQLRPVLDLITLASVALHEGQQISAKKKTLLSLATNSFHSICVRHFLLHRVTVRLDVISEIFSMANNCNYNLVLTGEIKALLFLVTTCSL